MREVIMWVLPDGSGERLETESEVRLRERRRTVAVVAVMFTVFVVAAILLDVFLPMGLDTREALIGMDGGIGAVTLTDGTAHPVLEAPPKGERYATWGLSPDRDRFVDVWYKTSGGKIEKASVQIRNASSGHLRVEYPIEPGPEFLSTVQVGYVPGEAAIWLLDSGKLSFLVYKTGELTEVTLAGSSEPFRATSVCFSPDQKQLAYTEVVDGAILLMVANVAGTVISAPCRVDPRSSGVIIPASYLKSGAPLITGPITWANRSTILVIGTNVDGTVLSYVDLRSPYYARWTTVSMPQWTGIMIQSLSAAPDTKGCAFLVRSAGEIQVRIDWNSRPDPEPLKLSFRDPKGPLRWAPF